MIETWKDIPEYGGKYQADREGNIRRCGMLIRSQDKEKIVVMNNTCNIFLRDYGEDGKYFVDASFAGKTGTTLAVYSKKEKAINVLNMIQNFYSNLKFCEFMGSDITAIYSNVFEMPNDEDVEE